MGTSLSKNARPQYTFEGLSWCCLGAVLRYTFEELSMARGLPYSYKTTRQQDSSIPDLHVLGGGGATGPPYPPPPPPPPYSDLETLSCCLVGGRFGKDLPMVRGSCHKTRHKTRCLVAPCHGDFHTKRSTDKMTLEVYIHKGIGRYHGSFVVQRRYAFTG